MIRFQNDLRNISRRLLVKWKMTEQKQVLVAQLRSRLLQEGKCPPLNYHLVKFKNDNFLWRYLRYTKYDLEKAETLIWSRVQYDQSNDIVNALTNVEFPMELADDFKFFFGGRDHQNQPVVMVPDMASWNLKKHIKEGKSAQVRKSLFLCHLIQEENNLETNSDFATILVNMGNFKYSHYLHAQTVTVLIEVLQLIFRHSPYNTGRFVIVNAPTILKFIIANARKVVPINVEFIIFGMDESNWKQNILEYFPAEGIIEEFGGSLKTHYEAREWTLKNGESS